MVNVTQPECLSKLDEVDHLVGAAADPGMVARCADKLPYQLEIWSHDASRLLSLIATLGHQATALAAYYAAIRECPGERLLVRVDGRTLADSGTTQAEQQAEFAPETKLSAREAQVVALLVRGASMKQVARTLGIPPRTVAFHKYRAMDTNGLRNNTELMDFAIRQGLLFPTTLEDVASKAVR